MIDFIKLKKDKGRIREFLLGIHLLRVILCVCLVHHHANEWDVEHHYCSQLAFLTARALDACGTF